MPVSAASRTNSGTWRGLLARGAGHHWRKPRHAPGSGVRAGLSVAPGSVRAELSGLDARHERGERRGGGVQHRAARILRVADGDHAERGDEVRGDLDALAAVAAVGGRVPTGDSVVTGCPFVPARSRLRMPPGRAPQPVADGRPSVSAARTHFPVRDGPGEWTRRTTSASGPAW